MTYRSTPVASWNEIERVRRNPEAFRPLAQALLTDPACEVSRFADGFLAGIATRNRGALSLRECEVLLDLRDHAEIHTAYRGLSIAALIQRCHEGSARLAPEDRMRIVDLYESGRRFVTGAELGWFTRICRELGAMEF